MLRRLQKHQIFAILFATYRHDGSRYQRLPVSAKTRRSLFLCRPAVDSRTLARSRASPRRRFRFIFFVSPLLKPGMGLKMRVGIPGGWRFSWHLERVNGARSGVGVAFTRDGTVVDVASRSRRVLFCKV